MEGLFVAPEGAACFAALKSLLAAGKIARDERVVIFNTGSGIKYLDCYERSILTLHLPPTALPLQTQIRTSEIQKLK